MKNLLPTAVLLVVCSFTLAAQVDTLTILHINDTHSNLAPIGPRTNSLEGSLGGIARAATLLGTLKATTPNALLLHAGDFFVGDLFFNVYFGVPELQMLAGIGLDAMAVGNHEFDLTPSTLETALDAAFVGGGFPLLSANLKFDSVAVQGLKKYIQPYTVKQVGAVKVGIFGLTTPATAILSQPSPVIVDENIIQVAAAMVDTLTARHCDVVVCLSHLGVALDKLVAENVPGINVIVGGHDHYLFNEPIAILNPATDTTWIVQANAFYLNAGEMQLTVSSGKVRMIQYQMHTIDESIPKDPTIDAVVNSLIAGIEATYGPVYTQRIGYAREVFVEVADSLLSQGYKDTPVGNLVTDAFRAYTGTQIAIEVGGSTAEQLYRGPLVAADVFRTVGYGFNTDNGLGYRLATFTMTGVAFKAGLEYGLSSIEENDEFLPQLSGASYIYNPHSPAGERVIVARVGNSNLNPDETYTITGNEFVPGFLQYLGIPFDNVRIISDTTEFQIVAAFIAQLDTIAPKQEGRVQASFGTGVARMEVQPPRQFVLNQNYPNPFNPTTAISFQLSTDSRVRLTVFDLLGREVTTLVNEELPVGTHKAVWDASSTPSGVYLYQLTAGSFVQTRKMVLLK